MKHNVSDSRTILPCFFIAASVLASDLVVGQVGSVFQLRDLPRTADMEQFKQTLSRTTPADPVSLYNEIQATIYSRQRLSNLRDQRSNIDAYKERFEADIDGVARSLTDLKTFCEQAKTGEDVSRWWAQEEFTRYRSILDSAAAEVGIRAEPLKNPAPDPTPGETCHVYAGKLSKSLPALKKTVTDQLSKYQQIEIEKIKNISEVDGAYKNRLDQLTRELEKAKQRKEEQTAASIASNLWVVILVLGGTAIVILLIVRVFPDNSQLELVQSGQVIQFITVLLLLTVIMALGLSGKIQETTLGTLLGGLGGYVLSQGVGRAAVHEAKKGQAGGKDT